jgi:CRP/FNR family transcriptional regulator, cyclic AMP receptor protein
MDTLQLLKSLTFFAEMDDSELIKFIGHLKTKTVKKNTFVIKENEHSNEMYLIKAGKVNVMVINSKGKEMILATLQEGEIFGELSLFDDEPRAANVVAQEDCVFLVINRSDFFNLIHQHPTVAIQVIKYLCHRLRLTNKTAESFALLNAYERLKKYFESYGMPGMDGNLTFTFHESQEDIGMRIGCSREMVSKIIKKLKEDHQCLYYKNNKIVIHKKLPLKL